jgi:hypothetical protein
MTRLARILWFLFAASAVTAGYLVLQDSRTRAPLGRPDPAGSTAAGGGAHPSAALAGRASLPSASSRDAGPKAELAGLGGPTRDGAGGNGAAEEGAGEGETAGAGDLAGEGAAGERGEGGGPTIEPEEFLAQFLELAAKGDLEALTGKMLPGAIRALRGPLMELLAGGEEAQEKMRATTADMQFSLEETPEGLLRVRMEGPGGTKSDLEIYLVPEEGAWKLAAPSDLEETEAVVNADRAAKRLQLLALCQNTFLIDDLDGDGPDYAARAGDLASGLDRSGIYEGVLDPEFVAAADTGRPLDGYSFGRISMAGNDFGYYAIPALRGPGPAETLLIDSRGRIWAKDLGGEPPPSEWPGPDPAAQGWKERKQWPGF